METIDPEFEVIEFTDGHPWLTYSGEVPDDVKIAMDISIRKWRVLVQLCKDDECVYDGHNETCGLCMWSDFCQDCPIALGHHNDCRDTPFWEYDQAYDDCDVQEMLKAARRELAFLKRLYKKEFGEKWQPTS